jgi:hypothetical protein
VKIVVGSVIALLLGVVVWMSVTRYDRENLLRATSPRAERLMLHCSHVHIHLRQLAAALGDAADEFHEAAVDHFEHLEGTKWLGVELCAPRDTLVDASRRCARNDETCMRAEVAKAILLTALH